MWKLFHALCVGGVCVLVELREEKHQPQEYLVEGVKALISALKTWLRREVNHLLDDICALIKWEVISVMKHLTLCPGEPEQSVFEQVNQD